MAPLVLHNVPDDELYVGKDGVTRPFAVVGAADEYVPMCIGRRFRICMHGQELTRRFPLTGGGQHGCGDRRQRHTGHLAERGHGTEPGRLGQAAERVDGKHNQKRRRRQRPRTTCLASGRRRRMKSNISTATATTTPVQTDSRTTSWMPDGLGPNGAAI